MVPTERVYEFHAVIPQPRLPAMPDSMQKQWAPDDAAREMVRGRMEVLGPVTVERLARDLDLPDTTLMEGATLALESEGRILRGQFTAIPDPRSPILHPISDPVSTQLEWCDRRLLARIHRYTLNRLRAEIEPVTAADFMRFLLHWQHIACDQKVDGLEGVAAVIEQLDGCEVPAAAWELEVLPARCTDYSPQYLDGLCLSGRVTWGRRSPMNGAGKVPLRRSPIALMLRDRAALWSASEEVDPAVLSSYARDVLDALKQRGASFFHELVSASRLLRTQVERALAELAGAGLVTADSYGGLRALLTPAKHSRRGRAPLYGVDTAGRWALLHDPRSSIPDPQSAIPDPQSAIPDPRSSIPDPQSVEQIARGLLKRYGVVFRSLLGRESGLPTWRELGMVYRRLEARGEIRGGRFVKGFGGEQFALPDAVGRLRAVRKLERTGELIAISAADPLNLVGIVTPDAKVPAITRNRVLFRDGIAIAALEAGAVRRLAECELSDESLRLLLSRRVTPPALRAYLQSDGRRERWLAKRRQSVVEGTN